MRTSNVFPWRDTFCTGCGTCAGVCPTNAIEMSINYKKGIYIPKLDNKKCDKCGICLSVCPHHYVNFQELNSESLGREDILLGKYLNCYIGHANDHDIRYNSTSGGLVTALLIFALEEGIIDGALVARMDKDRPLEPEVIIARTKDDIISASGSKYCPVPASVGLKEILNTNGKFAVVGLPCHIRGIRKAEENNKKLKEKIILHIGLFCSHTVRFSGTLLLLEKLGIKKENIREITYRGNGWPGYLSVMEKGRLIASQKSFFDYWFPLFTPYFFVPFSCMFCPDSVNEFSDISLGDAWLPQIKMKDDEGTSIIILRSKIGEGILKEAIEKRVIELTEINPRAIVRSQWTSLEFKKISLKSRISILKVLGKHMPDIETRKDLPTPNFLTYTVSIFQLINYKLPKNKFFYKFLKYLPYSMLKIYAFFILGLEYLSWQLAYSLRRD